MQISKQVVITTAMFALCAFWCCRYSVRQRLLVERARCIVTEQRLILVTTCLAEGYARRGELPLTLDEFTRSEARVSWKMDGEGVRDGWGIPFVYELAAGGNGVRLGSLGADGAEGGQTEGAADWQILLRPDRGASEQLVLIIVVKTPRCSLGSLLSRLKENLRDIKDRQGQLLSVEIEAEEGG